VLQEVRPAAAHPCCTAYAPARCNPFLTRARLVAMILTGESCDESAGQK
jgi:hypothetical protein